MKADQENTRLLFAFAGLWRHQQVEMQDPDTDRDTYTVITTMANALIEPIHPTRMPVIFCLNSRYIALWDRTGRSQPAKALSL